MKNKLILSLLILGLLFLMVSLVGCGQQGGSTRSDNTPNHKTPWETGIGGVTINMTSQEVISTLGEPDSVESSWWVYNKVGYITIGYDGKVSTIQQYYFDSTSVSTNIGHIHVGSTSQEVLAAYGNPDDVSIYTSSFVASYFIYWKDRTVTDDVQLEIKLFDDNTIHSIIITKDAIEH